MKWLLDQQSLYRLEAENSLGGAEQVEVSVDEMFDSCGLDVYSIFVAWLEGGKIQHKGRRGPQLVIPSH